MPAALFTEQGHEELHLFLGKLPSQEFASKFKDKIQDKSTPKQENKGQKDKTVLRVHPDSSFTYKYYSKYGKNRF